MDKFKVEWEVEDGYVGKSRPQSFFICSEDIPINISESELESLFEELLYEDFQRKIEPVSDCLNEFISWAQNIIEDEDEDEGEEDED